MTHVGVSSSFSGLSPSTNDLWYSSTSLWASLASLSATLSTTTGMDSFLAGAEPEVEEEEADTKLELRVPAFLKLVNCPATFIQLMRSEKDPISVF